MLGVIVVLTGTGCALLDDEPRVVPETGERQADPAAEVPRLFAARSFWNATLPADAPVDPKSPELVEELGRLVDAVAAERRGPWLGAKQGSTPIYRVPADQPTVAVQLENGDAPTRRSLQRALHRVPIPPDARPAPGTDAHLTVWQPATDRIWELFQVTRSEGRWHARWGGAIDDVSRSPGYYTKEAWPGAESYWGASGTSLPVVAGLIRPGELRRGRIDHVLSLNLPEVRAEEFAWPAQRTDGETANGNAIPEGARFRLPADLDLDSLDLPPVVRTIAAAAQQHGIVVHDRSSTVSFYAEWVPGPADPYHELIGPEYPSNVNVLMGQFPWKDLEVVRMSLCTDAGLRAQPGTNHGYGECRR